MAVKLSQTIFNKTGLITQILTMAFGNAHECYYYIPQQRHFTILTLKI